MPVTVAHLTTVDMSLRFLVLAQLRAVRDRGGRAIGISAPGPWVSELEAEGIEHFALRSSTRAMSVTSDVRAASELWTLVRRERVDVLHTHNPKPGLYGRVVGRAARVPIVVNTVHGLYATEDDPLATNDRPQLAGRAGVAGHTHRPGRRAQREVLDALGLELRDPRSGRADADGSAAAITHRSELRQHEEPEAHVDRGEVRDGHRHGERCYGPCTTSRTP